tara:strand:- start:5982 stop:6341 length:360 start_codon:yes stop_codon:yes gene_type:complete
MDLVLYAGYLWGKGIIIGAPWIVWSDSVRLGADTSLCLTISNVNGLVLTIDKANLPTDSRTSELIDTIVHAISTHIDTEQTVSFNCLDTDNDFMRTSERRLYELRYVCNNSILTPTNEE